jgi:hypothetical protein
MSLYGDKPHTYVYDRYPLLKFWYLPPTCRVVCCNNNNPVKKTEVVSFQGVWPWPAVTVFRQDEEKKQGKESSVHIPEWYTHTTSYVHTVHSRTWGWYTHVVLMYSTWKRWRWNDTTDSGESSRDDSLTLHHDEDDLGISKHWWPVDQLEKWILT